MDSVELENVVDGVYRVADENRPQPITCKAYNGSQPAMKLYIGDKFIKDL